MQQVSILRQMGGDKAKRGDLSCCDCRRHCAYSVFWLRALV